MDALGFSLIWRNLFRESGGSGDFWVRFGGNGGGPVVFGFTLKEWVVVLVQVCWRKKERRGWVLDVYCGYQQNPVVNNRF